VLSWYSPRFIALCSPDLSTVPADDCCYLITALPHPSFLLSVCPSVSQSVSQSRISNSGAVFLSVRVVQIWNKLPEEVVSAGSVSAFISRLNSLHVSFFNVLF